MKIGKYVVILSALLIGTTTSLHALASESIYTVKVAAEFSDVRIDIENAIANRGFKLDFHSEIGEMLNRTAADVGSSVTVYRYADTWQFCSSILSRKMVEVNPVNIAYCPYIIFAYETVKNPGTIVVGFRHHDVEDDASEAVLSEIDIHLTAIVNEVL